MNLVSLFIQLAKIEEETIKYSKTWQRLCELELAVVAKWEMDLLLPLILH